MFVSFRLVFRYVWYAIFLFFCGEFVYFIRDFFKVREWYNRWLIFMAERIIRVLIFMNINLC